MNNNAEEIRSRLRDALAQEDRPDASNPNNASVQTNVELTDEARFIADQFSTEIISPKLLTGLLYVIEIVTLAVLGMIIQLAYVDSEASSNFSEVYLPVLLAAPLLYALILHSLDGYSLHNLFSITAQFGRILSAWTIVFAIFVLIAFFAKVSDEFSRVWMLSWYISGAASVAVVRVGISILTKKWRNEGRIGTRTVIVGGGEAAAELIMSLEMQRKGEIQICGIFDDRNDQRSPAIVQGYPKLGTIEQLTEFARIAKIDMLIVCLPINAEKRVLQLLKKLWVLPVDIRLSAHNNKLRFRPRSYSYVGNVPFLDIFEKPIADWHGFIKRSFDLVVASLAIIALSPVFLVTALAVRLDSKGPVFFRQMRYGFNNEPIAVFKFRSLYHEMRDEKADKLVGKNDPRVTRVGAFIRKTSLDELPQLFNVLTGQLSLVGPRPHASNAKVGDVNALYTEVVEGYYARHRVKPGITGWAQINGWRGETDTVEKIYRRVQHDLYYIENWSLWLDIYILARTPFALLNTDQAY